MPELISDDFNAYDEFTQRKVMWNVNWCDAQAMHTEHMVDFGGFAVLPVGGSVHELRALLHFILALDDAQLAHLCVAPATG